MKSDFGVATPPGGPDRRCRAPWSPPRGPQGLLSPLRRPLQGSASSSRGPKTACWNVLRAPVGPKTLPQAPLTPPDPREKTPPGAWRARVGAIVDVVAHQGPGRGGLKASTPAGIHRMHTRNTACAGHFCLVDSEPTPMPTRGRTTGCDHRCACRARPETPTRVRDHGRDRRGSAGVGPSSRRNTLSTPEPPSMHGDVTRVRRDAQAMHDRVLRCTGRVSACATRCSGRAQQAFS